MRLTRESIAGLAARLRDMQPEEPGTVSKQEAVRMLAPEIKSMQKRGFTIDQVAARLRDHELVIAPATLKNYLRRAGTSYPQTAGKAARKLPARNNKALASIALNAAPQSARKTTTPAAAFTPAADTEEI